MNRLTEPECIRKCAAVVNLSAPNATGTMLEMQYSQMKCTYINRFFAITVGMNCRYSPRNILLSTMTLIEILLFLLDFAKSGLINGALLCKAVTVNNLPYELFFLGVFFGFNFSCAVEINRYSQTKTFREHFRHSWLTQYYVLGCLSRILLLLMSHDQGEIHGMLKHCTTLLVFSWKWEKSKSYASRTRYVLPFHGWHRPGSGMRHCTQDHWSAQIHVPL